MSGCLPTLRGRAGDAAGGRSCERVARHPSTRAKLGDVTPVRPTLLLLALTACGNSSSGGGEDCHLWDLTFPDVSETFESIVATDPGGVVVIAGRMSMPIDFGGGLRTPLAGHDAFVASFDAAGHWRWDHVFPGEGPDDQVYAIAVAPSGDVVVGGEFATTIDLGGGVRKPPNSNQAFVARFDSDGAWQWDHVFTSVYGAERVFGLGLDAGEGIVITGSLQGAVDFGGGEHVKDGPGGSAPTSSLLSFAADGTWRWDRIVGVAGGFAAGRSVGVAPDGSAVVVGDFEDTVDFGQGPRTSGGMSDAFVWGLDASGASRWSHTFGDVEEDEARSVAVDTDGTAYVVGSVEAAWDLGDGPETAIHPGRELFVASYDVDGAFRWKHVAGTHGDDEGRGVAVAAGTVAVLDFGEDRIDLGGGQLGPSEGAAVQIATYASSDGAYRWGRSFPDTQSETGMPIALTPAGAPVIIGSFDDETDFGGGPLVPVATDAFVVSLACP